MVKKKNNLSIYLPESVKNNFPLSRGFPVYKHFNEKHSFYRDKKRRTRDIKAIEYHFPGISQILKNVKEMENECIYCRLERDNNVDKVQVVLLELLKIANEIIASEQAYSRELEFRNDMCSLFLDENFHLLKIIKSLQEQIVILDNELINALDTDGTDYAETVFTQYPDVVTHDIFLQDTSRGWESIDWRALELGECELKRAYISQESESQLYDEINDDSFQVSDASFEYNETPTRVVNITDLNDPIVSHNASGFISPMSHFQLSPNLLPIAYEESSIDNSLNYIYEPDTTPTSTREMGFEPNSLFLDIDDHSYKSLDSYDVSPIADFDICTTTPLIGDLPLETNETYSSIDENFVDYQVSVDDLDLFEQLFTSRIQHYNEESDMVRLLNAENAYLYKIIENKLVIGNEINVEELGETIKLKEKIKIQNEHWERLEKLLSNYFKNNEIVKCPLDPNLNLDAVDEDVVKYLSVYASLSSILTERSFEKLLNDVIKNNSHVESLISSLNRISDKKHVENHLLKECRLQLSIQTELCNRLTSINNINLFGDSELIVELKKNISELNERVKVLEAENADLLSDCKNAAKVISMMESELQEKSVDIDRLNNQIINIQSKSNIDILHTQKYVNPNVEVPKRHDISNDSLECIMKKALGNCLKDLEYAESYTVCTTLVSSDTASEYYSDSGESDISISRVQRHPILPSLLSMLDRLHSGYMGLIRTLKEQCVIITRSEFDKYISLMNGLASMIRRYNTSIKYDHEIETIQILMQSEYSLSSSNLLYLLNIMSRLGELTQIILLDRESEINSSRSRTNARLEMAEDRIKLLEREKVKILAEKDDLRYSISGLKREIDRFKYPLDRISNRLDRSRQHL